MSGMNGQETVVTPAAAPPKVAVKAPARVVRKATPRDAVKILQCIEPMLDEMAYQLPEVVDTDALHWIVECIHQGLVVVATVEGRFAGSLGTMMQTWPWNRTKPYLTNTWYYVREEYRTHKVAFQLMRKLLDEYKKLPMDPLPPLQFGINSGVDTDLKERLIQRFGFTYCGGIMRLETT